MEVVSKARNGVIVFTVRGEIDGKTAPELHAAVAPQVLPEASVLLELSGVKYLSSAGLRVLLLLHREAAGQGARLVLVGLGEELRETMALTGFDRHFTLCDTVESGLDSLT